MLRVKGKLKLKEYYQLYFFEHKSYFNITIFIAILFSVISIDTLSIKQSVLTGDWKLVLFEWMKFFIIGVIIMAIILVLDATLHRASFLEDKEYIFSEEKIIIRKKNSETYVMWDEITKIRETQNHQIWELKQKKYLFLPNRFFDNDEQVNKFKNYINKKLKGKVH